MATLDAGFEAVTRALANAVPMTVSSGLRTEATTTDYVQIVSYATTTCTGTVSVVGEIKLGACIPLAFAAGGNSTTVTASGNVVTLIDYLYSYCKTISKSSSLPTGCNSGTSVYLCTASTDCIHYQVLLSKVHIFI